MHLKNWVELAIRIIKLSTTTFIFGYYSQQKIIFLSAVFWSSQTSLHNIYRKHLWGYEGRHHVVSLSCSTSVGCSRCHAPAPCIVAADTPHLSASDVSRLYYIDFQCHVRLWTNSHKLTRELSRESNNHVKKTDRSTTCPCVCALWCRITRRHLSSYI